MAGNGRCEHEPEDDGSRSDDCARCRSLELQLHLARQENARLRRTLVGYVARVRRHRFGRD